jgi:ribosomal protein S18 acetylase RimI-like enzyme
MINLNIRLIKSEDLIQIQDLVKQVIESDFPEYSDRTKESILKDELNIQDKLPNPYFKIYGAFDGDKIVGFLIGTQQTGGVCDIHWAGVLKDYQGQGIGRRLVEHYINEMLGQGAHTVHLFASEKIKGFYEKLGFEEAGFFKKSYWGTDDYIMSKLIQEPKEENFLKE